MRGVLLSKYTTVAITLLAALTFIFTVAHIDNRAVYIVIASAVGVVILLSTLSPAVLWAVITFLYITVESEHYHLGNFPFPLLPFPLIALLNAGLLILTLYHYAIRSEQEILLSKEERWVVAFLCCVLLSTGVGMINGYTTKAILKETGLMLGYIGFIAVIRSKRKLFPIFWTIIIAGATIASLEYIYLAYSVIKSPYLFSHRIATRQAVIGVPILTIGYSLLLWGNRKNRIVGIAMITSLVPILILSLQRSLWIASILGITASTTIGLVLSKTARKRALITLLSSTIVITIAIISGITFIKHNLGEEFVSTVEMRINTFQNIEHDISYRTRLSDTQSVFKFKLEAHPTALLWGRGLGDRVQRTYPRSEIPFFIDNTYIVILWKMGSIGLVVFISMLMAYLAKFLHLAKTKEDNVWAIGYASFMIAFMFYALTTNIGVNYRFITVFWGIIATGFLYYKEEETNV